MAITQTMCTSFKKELLEGKHNFLLTGGNTLTRVDPSSSGTTGLTDFADISWGTEATFTARGALIYNVTNGNRAVLVLDFGADKTVTAGTFTITFPTADASNAIIRIA